MKIDFKFLNYSYNRNKTTLTVIIGVILGFAIGLLTYALISYDFTGEDGVKNIIKLTAIIVLAVSSIITFGVNWYLLKVGPLNRKGLFYFNIVFYEISLYIATLVVGIEYSMDLRVPLFFYVVTFTLPLLFILKPHRFAALSVIGSVSFIVIGSIYASKNPVLHDELHRFIIQISSAGIMNVILIYKMFGANQNAFNYQEKLARESHIDFLTGLNNRRALDQKIANLDNSLKYVAIMDIDNFKSINDEFGHEAGDDCLIIVSRKLINYFGKDNVYRFGGDEIVVVTDKSFEEISAEIKRISQSIKEKYEFSGISVGVCPLGNEEAKDNIIKADKALYAAKYSGKGQCILYTEK